MISNISLQQENLIADYTKANLIQDGQYFAAYFNASKRLESISGTIGTNMLSLIYKKILGPNYQALHGLQIALTFLEKMELNTM